MYIEQALNELRDLLGGSDPIEATDQKIMMDKLEAIADHVTELNEENNILERRNEDLDNNNSFLVDKHDGLEEKSTAYEDIKQVVDSHPMVGPSEILEMVKSLKNG